MIKFIISYRDFGLQLQRINTECKFYWIFIICFWFHLVWIGLGCVFWFICSRKQPFIFPDVCITCELIWYFTSHRAPQTLKTSPFVKRVKWNSLEHLYSKTFFCNILNIKKDNSSIQAFILSAASWGPSVFISVVDNYEIFLEEIQNS